MTTLFPVLVVRNVTLISRPSANDFYLYGFGIPMRRCRSAGTERLRLAKRGSDVQRRANARHDPLHVGLELVGIDGDSRIDDEIGGSRFRHTNKNPLRKVTRSTDPGETVDIVRGDRRRRLHKAFLRYHDANNWPLLRDALKSMGRADLIGNGKHHLIPTFQPLGDGTYQSARKKNSTAAAVSTSKASQPVKGRILTQHTGLPPRRLK